MSRGRGLSPGYYERDPGFVHGKIEENKPVAVFHLVSLAAVFSIVTQRSSPQEERCVTIPKTAARETIFHPPMCCFYLLSLNLRVWPDFSAKW